ncbi:Aste57867_6 [Aphanomyces stellatus]|uniref:Aste57867_6 protein n=1 Tax=Aphanomyces stellatus TaxID=120398 RepID=A0A485K6F2_9STRA|nr:hypothetical protein As57867_000006 [Aphanomyces stellatus]VFT77232.1 Aste57867_6 [Aphanomyces stellatus]
MQENNLGRDDGLPTTGAHLSSFSSATTTLTFSLAVPVVSVLAKVAANKTLSSKRNNASFSLVATLPTSPRTCRHSSDMLSLWFFTTSVLLASMNTNPNAQFHRPFAYPELFATANWSPVLGTTTNVALTRPYTTYIAPCPGVNLTFPPEYPAMSPNGDRACILTSTPGKAYRGGLELFNPANAQVGLVHKMVGTGVLKVSHVESLPSWADTIIFVNLGVETLGNDLQSATKVTTLVVVQSNIRDIGNVLFPTQLTSLNVARNQIVSVATLSAPNLKYLDLSFNNLTSIKNTVFPTTLRQLYLFNNPNMSVHKATFPPNLQTLHMHNCGLTSASTATWSPMLDELILANNRISSIGNTSFPPALTSLYVVVSFVRSRSSLRSHLGNNLLTQVRANFPSTLQYLYLGGNNITALYANQSQFDLLSGLLNANKTSLACGAATSEAYPGDCEIVLSTTTTNLTCQGHIATKMLWGIFPVCIVPNDAPLRQWDGSGDGRWKNWTTAPPIGSWKGGHDGKPYFPFMLVGALLVSVLLLLGGYYAYRHWKKKKDTKWYNEMTTKDKLGNGLGGGDGGGGLTEHFDIVNDIRNDTAFAVFRIPANHIERGDLVARGGYGLVYVATLRTVGKAPTQVAMKQMLPEKTSDMAAIEEFMDEIRVSARLYHPKIVRFIGLSWTNLANLSMINEYMERGDLWSLLEVNRTQRRIDWNVNPHFRVDFARPMATTTTWLSNTSSSHKQAGWQYAGVTDPNTGLSKFSILLDIAQALQYLHTPEINLIHRDIKAKNVLLHDAGTAKLTDFGTSRETIEDQTMTAEIGTVPWIAPEVLMGVRYSAKADIYSFGVLMSEIDLCIVPYSDLKMIVPTAGVSVAMAKARISMMVVSGELRPSFSKGCPQAMIEIAQRCLAFNPLDRPSADELVSWFLQFNE